MPGLLNRALAFRTKPLGTVLLLCGAIGAVSGALFAPYQVSVETAQALSGTVPYAPDCPNYAYHVKVYTIANQLGALLLRLTGSEPFVSRLLAALVGMVCVQAVGLIIFVCSRKTLASVLGAAFFNLVSLYPVTWGVFSWGVVYDPEWLNATSTYNLISHFFPLLVIGLLCAGPARAGLFLLALAPAVHPSAGLWLWLVACSVGAFGGARAGAILRRNLRWFLAGLALFALSLLLQRAFIARLPAAPAELQAAFRDSFVANFDLHRRPFRFASSGVLAALAACACCALQMGRRHADAQARGESGRRALLAFAAVATAGALLAALITRLPPNRVPGFLLALMPGRYINLPILLLWPAALGALARLAVRRPRLGGTLLAGYLITALRLAGHALRASRVSGDDWGDERLQLAYLLSTVLFGATAALCLRVRPHRTRPAPLARAAAGSVLALALLCAAVLPYLARRPETWQPSRLSDWRTVPALAQVARHNGVLLISHGLKHAQLITRRPVLFDPDQLDGFMYAPEAAARLLPAIREIYGVDILRKRREPWREDGSIPPHYRALWEQRTPAVWRQLKNTHAFQQILTPPDWTLRLPCLVDSDLCRLYAVP